MVRLKVDVTSTAFPIPENFNSTMVRLKVFYLIHNKKLCTFQFHYGTIKRHCAVIQLSHIFDFNSTMVRLKEKIYADFFRYTQISIPLWYD